MFSRWLKQCTKTYLDLFIRLIAIYFAVYMCQIFMNTSFDVPETNGLNDLIIRAILMLGTLMFAKQLPKFLEELFGFNLGSGFTLNPMRRLRDVPGMNRLGGGLGNAYQRAVGSFQQQTAMGTNRGRAILRALGHGAAGIPGGVAAGRGFRGQMAAARSAQNDLYDAAAKLRMQDPTLSEEEALRRARSDMRGDRIKGALGLRTSQDDLHRMETELGIRERAHEKTMKKKFEEEEEELRLRDEAVATQKRNIAQRKRNIDEQKVPYQERMDAISKLTNADKNVADIARKNIEDKTKKNLFTMEGAAMERAIESDKLKLEQFQKDYIERQNSAPDAIVAKTNQINELTKKLNSTSPIKLTERASIQAEIDKLTKERDQLNGMVGVDVKDTAEYKKLSASIEHKENARDAWHDDSMNEYQDSTIYRSELNEKNQEYQDLVKTIDDAKIRLASATTNSEKASIAQEIQAMEDIVKKEYGYQKSSSEISEAYTRLSNATTDAERASIRKEIDNKIKERESYVSQYAKDKEVARLENIRDTYQKQRDALVARGASQSEIDAIETLRAEFEQKVNDARTSSTAPTYYEQQFSNYSDRYEDAVSKLLSSNLSAEERESYEIQRDEARKYMDQIEKDTSSLNKELYEAHLSRVQEYELNGERTGNIEFANMETSAKARYQAGKTMADAISDIKRSIDALEDQKYALKQEEMLNEEATRYNEERRRLHGEAKAADERYKKQEYGDVKSAIEKAKAAVDAEHKANESRRNESHNNNGGGRH